MTRHAHAKGCTLGGQKGRSGHLVDMLRLTLVLTSFNFIKQKKHADIGLSLACVYFGLTNQNKLKAEVMDIIPMLLKEMGEEAQTTRKMLGRIPVDRLDWQPHVKSMTIRHLATHIAELPSWVSITLNTSELDFATSPYTPTQINSAADLLALHEKSLAEGKAELEKTNEDELLKIWTLRNGEQVLSVRQKVEVIRMAFCQIVHHRAQLGVFLRLLDVPIPGSYGPSADDAGF
jgi:uncharacterized damage-inducible protein DinB